MSKSILAIRSYLVGSKGRSLLGVAKSWPRLATQVRFYMTSTHPSQWQDRFTIYCGLLSIPGLFRVLASIGHALAEFACVAKFRLFLARILRLIHFFFFFFEKHKYEKYKKKLQFSNHSNKRINANLNPLTKIYVLLMTSALYSASTFACYMHLRLFPFSFPNINLMCLSASKYYKSLHLQIFDTNGFASKALWNHFCLQT